MATFKRFRWFFIGLFFLIVLYIGGVYYFWSHTYPRTVVNGEPLPWHEKDTLFERVASENPVQFQGRFEENLSLSQADIDYTYKIKEKPSVGQNPFAWPWRIFHEYNYDVDYEEHYDEQKLDDAIQKAGFDPNGTETQDAHIDIQADAITLVPEVEGTRVNLDVLKQEILEGLRHAGTEPVLVEKAYTLPTIRKDNPDLLAEKEKMDAIAKHKIILDFEDRTYALTGGTLLGLYAKDEKGNYQLSEEALYEWVRQIAIETDTYGISHTFYATGIGEMTVSGGIYGWQMDVQDTADQIKEKLDKGEDGTMEPSYNMRGLTRATDDIGGTYVEVDLSRQHLWCYVDGELQYESDLVSGMGNSRFATPTGVDKIWSRERDVVLRGFSYGTDHRYESPVQYWMPINWKGIGLHDASWRSSFGGSIYQGNGSNGCLNLPLETAKFIYNTYEINTPVIVYES